MGKAYTTDTAKAWGYHDATGSFVELPKVPMLEAGMGPPPFTVRLPSGESRLVIEAPDCKPISCARTECAHCRNGYFDDQRFGEDVECVNGVLIDIDVAHEGYHQDVSYPLAPCHPDYHRQDEPDFRNDSQDRLSAWKSCGTEELAGG
jgi:hypothetical protein